MLCNIHIVSIVRYAERDSGSGISMSKFLNSPNMGVVNAITIKNERCWIIYEITGDIILDTNSSLEELVCEVAFAVTHTMFLTLTVKKVA